MTSPPRKRGVRTGTRGGRAVENYIETANKKTDAEFIAEYLRPSEDWTSWTHPKTGAKYTLNLANTGRLSEVELAACFELIDDSSGQDYRNSSLGWHPAMKKNEMRSPELRYILVKANDVDGGEASGSIRGFASFMPTYENGEPVVYLYEIHLRPELQGTGLGRRLMGHVNTAASHIPSVEKVMLTCFLSNEGGRRFYDKVGFEQDAFSPADRTLRGGRVVTSDYVILSRRITEGGGQ